MGPYYTSTTQPIRSVKLERACPPMLVYFIYSTLHYLIYTFSSIAGACRNHNNKISAMLTFTYKTHQDNILKAAKLFWYFICFIYYIHYQEKLMQPYSAYFYEMRLFENIFVYIISMMLCTLILSFPYRFINHTNEYRWGGDERFTKQQNRLTNNWSSGNKNTDWSSMLCKEYCKEVKSSKVECTEDKVKVYVKLRIKSSTGKSNVKILYTDYYSDEDHKTLIYTIITRLQSPKFCKSSPCTVIKLLICADKNVLSFIHMLASL